MPGKRKQKSEEQPPKKGRGLRAGAAVNNEPVKEPEKEGKYKGPWFRIEANARLSKTYTGKVDFGTYTVKEKNKGVVQRRIDMLTKEGYTGISVVEVPALDD